jgi:hypothetical protein
LEIDCGYGPLDIIVTNSNYGGGLGKTFKRVLNLIFLQLQWVLLKEITDTVIT